MVLELLCCEPLDIVTHLDLWLACKFGSQFKWLRQDRDHFEIPVVGNWGKLLNRGTEISS